MCCKGILSLDDLRKNWRRKTVHFPSIFQKPPQEDHLSNGFVNADSKIKTDADFDVDSYNDNDVEGNDDDNGAVVHVAHGLKATRCKMLPQFHFQLQHWLCTTFALHLHRLCATFVLRFQCICTAFAALQFRLNLHCVYSAFALLLQFRLNCTGLQFLALGTLLHCAIHWTTSENANCLKGEQKYKYTLHWLRVNAH